MTHKMMRYAAPVLAVAAAGCEAGSQQTILNGVMEVLGSTLVTWLLSFLLPV